MMMFATLVCTLTNRNKGVGKEPKYNRRERASSTTSQMGATDYVDGLLEGHEAQGTRTLYRLFIVAFVTLSLFSGVANIATLGKEGHRNYDVLTSISILGLTAMVLQNVKWYRQDNQDPKHRRSTVLLMAIVLLLDIGSCIAFHQTMAYQPLIIDVSPPITPAPNVTTPAPANLSALVERYYAENADNGVVEGDAMDG